MNHDNKERRVNNTQAASAAEGGALHVGNITATGTVGHVKLSQEVAEREAKVVVSGPFAVIQSELCLYHADPPHYVADLGVSRALVMN